MWYYVSKWVCGVMLLVNECVRGYWPEGPIQDSGCHITDLLDVDIGS